MDKKRFPGLGEGAREAPVAQMKSTFESMQKSQSNGFNTLDSFYNAHSNEYFIQAVPEGNLKLDEMITLGLLKRSSLTGPIKKMLHAPTQKLFAVKEVPLSSREVRHLLKQWLNRWEGL